ncbi:MAG: RNA polymerase factor sigma-70 [Chloroflexi bacterium ADurb.Bin360]|nr:MAG: RNA polymerase factor sigma-70 [Chloroflexi bacterium ADurb.Bin360]
MDQKTLELCQEADWGAIRRDLLVHTAWQARRYLWNHGGYLDLAEGYTIEDVVQEVIVKTLSGVRKWDPEKGPLLPWLYAQSRSILDALAQSASHRHEMHIPDMEVLIAAQSLDPLEIIIEREREAQIRHKTETLIEIVEEDPELQEVLQVILAGCEPRPRHIALELGISVREVDNRLKRLRRRATCLAELALAVQTAAIIFETD